MITAIIEGLAKLPADLLLNVTLIIDLILFAGCLVFLDWIALRQVKTDVLRLRNILKAARNDGQSRQVKIMGAQLAKIKCPAVKAALLGCSHTEPDGTVSAVSDVRDHFGLNRIVSQCGHRKTADKIPGFIAGVGLLGSVLSLLAVYCQMTVASATSQTTAARDVLLALIPGLLVVMVTAILLAVLYQMIDRSALGTVQKLLNKLHLTLEESFPVISDTEMLRTMAANQQKVAARLQDVGTTIGDRLTQAIQAELVPAMMTTFRDLLAEQLKPSVVALDETVGRFASQALTLQQQGMAELAVKFADRMEFQFSDHFSQLAGMLTTLTNMQTDGSQRSEVLLDGITKAADLQAQINQETGAAIQTLADSRRQLADIAGVMENGLAKTGELAGVLESMFAADREAGDRLQAERENLQTLNSTYIDTMNKQIIQMQDDLNSEIESIFSKFTAIYSATFENIDASTTDMLTNYKDTVTNLLTLMDDQVRELGFMAKEISGEVATLNSTMKTSAEAFSEQLQISTQSTFTSFDESLSNISHKLANTAEIIRDSIDDLPAAVIAVRNYLAAPGDDHHEAGA